MVIIVTPESRSQVPLILTPAKAILIGSLERQHFLTASENKVALLLHMIATCPTTSPDIPPK